jgi:hypothetical protein
MCRKIARGVRRYIYSGHSAEIPPSNAQRMLNGVSLDEYDKMFSVFNDRVCAHLGLRCPIRTDGDWSVMTYSGRGSAAVLAFPRGTHSVALSAQDLPNNPQLAGTWEFTWTPSGIRS